MSNFLKDNLNARYVFDDGISVSFDLIEEVLNGNINTTELQSNLSLIEYEHIQEIIKFETGD